MYLPWRQEEESSRTWPLQCQHARLLGGREEELVDAVEPHCELSRAALPVQLP